MSTKTAKESASGGCRNCHATERNLAQAYLRIERLLSAERNLSLAEAHAIEAAQSIMDRRETLRDLRKETAALEVQR